MKLTNNMFLIIDFRLGHYRSLHAQTPANSAPFFVTDHLSILRIKHPPFLSLNMNKVNNFSSPGGPYSLLS
jgi:hypothetical protein